MTISSELVKKITETHEGVAVLQNRMRDLHQAINGNGQPGLKDRMTVAEQQLTFAVNEQKACKKRMANAPRYSHNNRMFWLGVAMVAVGILTIWFK